MCVVGLFVACVCRCGVLFGGECYGFCLCSWDGAERGEVKRGGGERVGDGGERASSE